MFHVLKKRIEVFEFISKYCGGERTAAWPEVASGGRGGEVVLGVSQVVFMFFTLLNSSGETKVIHLLIRGHLHVSIDRRPQE